MNLYDNTRISAFRRCPRRFYFRHVRHWASGRISSALAFGQAWHDMMDIIWSDGTTEEALVKWRDTMQTEGIDIDNTALMLDSKHTEGIAKAMIQGYVKKHRDFLHSVELIQCERPFAVPLTADDELFYVGRIDKVFRKKQDGKIYFAEHKTTSSYKKDGPFRESFLASFSPNSQVDGYLFAGHMIFGDEFREVWVDAALVHKTVHNGFRFIPVNRQLPMLDSWLWEANYFIAEIERNLATLESFSYHDLRDASFLSCFPKKTDACDDYAGCSYRDVCRFHPNPGRLDAPPQGFIEKKWEPFNELNLQAIGLAEEK